MTDRMAPLLAIGGPTASGKTELAIRLAHLLDGEIVNADSRQVYRGMDIGTAKPTPAQRSTVRHHLLDVVGPSEEFTLAQYLRLAHLQIQEIQGRGRLPVLVGGTGLYLRAVLEGYTVPEVPPNAELRRDLEARAAEEGLGSLMEQLRTLDPQAAERIDGRNMRRVVRALEVTISLGLPFSSLQRKYSRYRCLLLVLHGDRSHLYARADTRLQLMLESGFESEVRALLEAGYAVDLPAFSALGYREFAAVLHGEQSRDGAIEATKNSTHDFIRRQTTWFRREREAVVLDLTRPDLLRAAVETIEPWFVESRTLPDPVDCQR